MVIGGSAAGRGASASLPMKSASVLAKYLWYVAPVVAKIPWLTYSLTTMVRLSARA